VNTQIQGDLTSSGRSEAADGASQEGGVSAVGITGHLGGGVQFDPALQQRLDSVVARRGQTAPPPSDDLFCNTRF